MDLLKLRVLAEEAIKSDAYHYDFADLVEPKLVLKLLDAIDIYRDTIIATSKILRADGRARLALAYGRSSGDEILGLEDVES